MVIKRPLAKSVEVKGVNAMGPKAIFAVLGIVAAIVSIFYAGGSLPILAGGVAFLGIAILIPPA